jgi:hypothetical protein
MKVNELREQIKSWNNEGKLKEQTVEFIIDSKKYFASDVKAGVNTMSFEVTRNNYKPLPLAELKQNLSIAGGDIAIEVSQAGKAKNIEQLYLSNDFIEITLS